METICWLLLAAVFIVIEIVTLGLTTISFSYKHLTLPTTPYV